MFKERSQGNATIKWKSYITGIMMRNFISLRKIDKYFRGNISVSMAKAIEENWLRILGRDNEIICLNISKDNDALGISLQGINVFSHDRQEMIQRHYLRVIIPHLCIGSTKKFMVGDELLEVNGLKIYGMKTKEVLSALRKLPKNIQFVVARAIRRSNEDESDYGGSEDIHSSISFYDPNEDLASHTSTMKSNSSLFSATSRDYGSLVSDGGLIDGRFDSVVNFLHDILGWRGPLVVEFRKRSKESLGLALGEIKDPKSNQLIIVFKTILPESRAANDGRLHVGDRLLQVNGKSVNGVDFRKVCQWMKSAPSGRLILYICKPHFPDFNSELADYLPDNDLYQTLLESDKLPKLREETDHDSPENPPVPENCEEVLLIKGTQGDRLGVFLDIHGNGENGCRIKKLGRGLIRDNGTLREGDFITTINKVSLRVNEKNQLTNCIGAISEYKGDYKITFLKKELVANHENRCSTVNTETYPPLKCLQSTPDIFTNSETLRSLRKTDYLNTVHKKKVSFETYDVTIENDGKSNLGLVLIPCLNDPSRYVSIADINPDSLVERSQLLKVNDIIIAVNNHNLEYIAAAEVGRYLKHLLDTESAIHFTVKRFINSDDLPDGADLTVENKYELLSDLPDMHFCTVSKGINGFGFSVLGLKPNYGVIINDISPDSSAEKTDIMKAGHRIIILNNRCVSTSPVEEVIKIIKNSQHSIGMILEAPKFREFSVHVAKDSSNSLGLNIAGGIDTKFPMVIVESVVSDSECQYSVPLHPEDIIVEANEISMLNRTHADIITILRGLPLENRLKVWRPVPFWNRDFPTNIDSSSNSLDDYLKCCQFSVTIIKPVASIASFGISFNDMLILDPASNEIQCRYKTVIYVENNSLCEKYAPEVIEYCYLIAINGDMVDENISCEDLKMMIDSKDRVELLMSRDIPYYFKLDEIKVPRVRPVELLHKNSIGATDYTNRNRYSQVISSLPSCEYMTLTSEEGNIVTPVFTEQISDNSTAQSDTDNEEFPPPPPLDDVPSGLSNKNFGITVNSVTVPHSDHIELGFRVVGGLRSGPGGETLPVYVVGVERNTCNWPEGVPEPWLSHGVQLLEMNGYDLTSMTAEDVNRLLCSTPGDLTFKVVKFKI